MTDAEIRLECLRLAVPRDIANPDVALILDKAKAFERYVMGEGHAVKAPSEKTLIMPAHKPGHGPSSGPRQHR